MFQERSAQKKQNGEISLEASALHWNETKQQKLAVSQAYSRNHLLTKEYANPRQYKTISALCAYFYLQLGTQIFIKTPTKFDLILRVS